MPSQPKTKAMLATISKELPFEEMLARVSEGATQTQLANLVAERTGKPAGSISHYYVNRWIHADPERSEAWKEAKQIAANRYADKVSEVIDSVQAGTLDAHSAKVISANAQWLASRLNPKEWGDRIAVDQTTLDLTTVHLQAMRDAMRTVGQTDKTETVDT